MYAHTLALSDNAQLKPAAVALLFVIKGGAGLACPEWRLGLGQRGTLRFVG